MEADYAPGISSNLVRTARLARSDDDALTSLSDQIPITTAAGQVALPAPAVLTAPEAVASRAVRSALRLCGDAYPGSMSDVETVMEGSVQYAEDRVRITAQLIDPQTGAHVW